MKKLFFYLPTMDIGGAERNFLRLINFYKKKGHNVCLVLNKKKGRLLKDLEKDIRVINLDVDRTFKSIFFLRKLIILNKPDIFFSSLTHCNIVLIIANIFSIFKTKVYVKECNNFKFQLNYGPLLNVFYIFFISFIYIFASKIISVSKSLEKQLKKILFLNPKKILTIYNSLDSIEIKKKSKVNYKKIFKNNYPTIISVGKLKKQKNYINLIKAINILNKNKKINLIIIGSGSERKKLQKLILKFKLSKKIKIIQETSNPFKYMANSDLFVLSSNYEGNPNVILEALCLKMKIVSTNCDFGPSEILENGKYGTLVKVNDYTDLAKGINLQLRNNKFLNYPNFKKFSIEHVANRYMQNLKL